MQLHSVRPTPKHTDTHTPDSHSRANTHDSHNPHLKALRAGWAVWWWGAPTGSLPFWSRLYQRQAGVVVVGFVKLQEGEGRRKLESLPAFASGSLRKGRALPG